MGRRARYKVLPILLGSCVTACTKPRRIAPLKALPCVPFDDYLFLAMQSFIQMYSMLGLRLTIVLGKRYPGAETEYYPGNIAVTSYIKIQSGSIVSKRRTYINRQHT